jgi:hypothetical protein
MARPRMDKDLSDLSDLTPGVFGMISFPMFNLAFAQASRPRS